MLITFQTTVKSQPSPTQPAMVSPIFGPKTINTSAVRMKPENSSVRPIASVLCFQNGRVSGTSYTAFSALMIEAMPLEAAHSAPSTPSESRPLCAPRTISRSVFCVTDAASGGSARVTYSMRRSMRFGIGSRPSSAVRNSSAGNSANRK